MAKISIVCPSGLTGEVRGLKVKETDTLASATRRKRYDVIDSVMTNCWLSAENRGPYSFDDAPKWDDVLQGDINFILMKIRIATFGSGYSFKVQCKDEFCREPFEWVLDLDDLPVQELPQESRDQLASENKFFCTINEKKYTFTLPTGKTAKRADKVKRNSRGSRLSCAVRMRRLEDEGVHSNDIKRFLADMDMGDLGELIAGFDKHDCGVDGDLEIECPDCGSIQEMTLPFEGDFFFPKHQKTQRGRMDTSSTATPG